MSESFAASSNTRLLGGYKHAAAIPNARLVVAERGPPEDERLLEAITYFLGAETRTRPLGDDQARVFRAVLFTDLVGHMEMMSRLGDERGREVLR